MTNNATKIWAQKVFDAPTGLEGIKVTRELSTTPCKSNPNRMLGFNF